MNTIGFNLRSTVGYVTDVQPSGYAGVCTFIGAGAYSGGAGFGYLSSNPTVANNTTSGDVRLSGNHNYTSLLFQLRINIPSGNYKFRLGIGATGSTAAHDCLIWDGGCYDGATLISNGNHTNYTASTAFALNRYTIVGSNLYKATVAGTTGAASAPTHTSGTATDGTVTWIFIKSAILRAVNASVTNGSQMDATGAIHTNANWAANNAESAQVAITQGFITITRGQTANISLRHFAYSAQSTPLTDALLKDVYGVATTAPTLFAAQPEGFPLLELSFTSGATAVENITLGGALAAYVTLATLNGKQYIVANGTRIPDALAGTRTLTITQTDGSSTISGSPYVSTFDCTIVTSGGRDTSNSLLGRISTGAYLLRQSILAAHAGKWQGYTGQSFASDQVCNSAADFLSKWNAITPDGSSWYRLQLSSGTYEANITPNNKNFGSGGILIEPAAGHDPEINFTTNNFVVRGLHVRGLKQPITPPGGSFYAWRFGATTGGVSLRARFTNNRFGAMFKAGMTEENLYAVANTTSTPFFTVQGEQLDIIDNIFDGCAQCIGITGVRLAEVRGNTCLRGGDDFLAYALQGDATAPIGVFADDNMYLLLDNNCDHREIDYAGFTTTAHRDTIGGQVRPNLDSPYAAQRINAKNPVNWAVGNRCYRGDAWYTVAAITTGVAGEVPPTGTANGQIDGGVTWNYGGVFNSARKLNVLIQSSTGNSIRSITSDIADGQFFIDSSNDYGATTAELNVVCIDNIAAGASAFGFNSRTLGTCYVEFNTFSGPNTIQAGNVFIGKFINAAGAAKLLAYRNVVGQVPSGVVGLFGGYYNTIASFFASAPIGQRPGDVLNGPFVTDGTGRWSFTLTDSVATTKETLRNDLLAVLKAPDLSFGALTGLISSPILSAVVGNTGYARIGYGGFGL